MKRQDAMFVDGGATVIKLGSCPYPKSDLTLKTKGEEALARIQHHDSISYQFLAFQISCSILRT